MQSEYINGKLQASLLFSWFTVRLQAIDFQFNACASRARPADFNQRARVKGLNSD